MQIYSTDSDEFSELLEHNDEKLAFGLREEWRVCHLQSHSREGCSLAMVERLYRLQARTIPNARYPNKTFFVGNHGFGEVARK